MRNKELESKSFTDPAWNSVLLQQYTGPIFRCCIYWHLRGSDKQQTSDIEAPSTVALKNDIATACRRIGQAGKVEALSYGPHTEPEPFSGDSSDND